MSSKLKPNEMRVISSMHISDNIKRAPGPAGRKTVDKAESMAIAIAARRAEMNRGATVQKKGG
ncbi:MAG: hypothetical protein AB7F19_07555 [Candidatus Babeliales bacterium]